MKDYTVIDINNIKKIFNKDFEILVNIQPKKKPQITIIDKRNNTVYNNIKIAFSHIIS